MIRTYRRTPKFDDGFDFWTNPQVRNDFLNQSDAPIFSRYPDFDTYGDDYVNPNIQANVTPDYNTYKIKKGDSLSKIAMMHGMSPMEYKKLAEINGISDPNRIEAGDDLYIPKDWKRRSNTSRIGRKPINKPTTSVQDRKQAKKTYDQSIAQADKKAKQENAAAHKAIKEANKTLEANDQQVYTLPKSNATNKNKSKYKKPKNSSMTQEAYDRLVKEGYILKNPVSRPFVPNKTYGQTYPKAPKGGQIIKNNKGVTKKHSADLEKKIDRAIRIAKGLASWYETFFGG